MSKSYNHSMKSLPTQERPYEKCWERGAAALTDAELLSAIMRTGCAGESALQLAKRLLDQPGCQGLAGLYHYSLQELISLRGIGRVKAIQIKCICELARRIAKKQTAGRLSFSDPQSVAEHYMEDLRHEEKEKVLLLLLDGGNALLGEEIISVGTVNEALVTPREIFRTAFSYHAVSIVLLHNHPSGNPAPSREDLRLTERVRESGELLGIRLLDHLIIGDGTAYSFCMEGLL